MSTTNTNPRTGTHRTVNTGAPVPCDFCTKVVPTGAPMVVDFVTCCDDCDKGRTCLECPALAGDDSNFCPTHAHLDRPGYLPPNAR